MRPVDLIRRKRDGGALEPAAIDAFVQGASDGTWSSDQLAAMLMAIVWRGMDVAETARLTSAMARSGRQLRFPTLPGPFVDKHSTGGVGDKTSLVLAPVVAACGACVPMMSGRGLGHTGGTLDKLESIPGYRTELTPTDIEETLRRAGCSIFSQSADIAPADRRLYALRDVTATVESVPLITASILSKKFAEGLDGLVLDVKVGRGAFMTALPEARALARALVDAAQAAGLRTEALITRMDAPLGRAVGNALEVAEAIDTLQGRGTADLVEVVLALAARMLVVAGLESDAAAARARAHRALDTGAALERFRAMVAAQGGDARVIDHRDRLPAAPGRVTVAATQAGIVQGVDAARIAYASLGLGAGRERAGDAVDHAVGILVRAKPGDRVGAGEPLAEIHHREGRGLEPARALVSAAFEVGDEARSPDSLIVERMN